jgi:hypothetical protein
VFAPIAVWLLLQRQLRLALRAPVLGWAAASAVAGLAWYAWILWCVPGAFESVVGNAVLPLGTNNAALGSVHYRNAFYYLPRLPLQTLPASLLLPWVVVDGVRTRFWRNDPRLRFIATSALALLVAWSFVPQKQMHYLLPIVPLQALLIGSTVARWLEVRAQVRVVGAEGEHGGADPVGDRPWRGHDQHERA